MSKRQLTLVEALKGPKSPTSKRARLSSPPLASSSSSSSAPLASTSKAAAPPFSIDAYQASLSTKGSEPTEADLLRLECETLDPSWLSLLKDEIKKPYFRQLKEFLWKEGLRGTKDKDSKGKLTVFPPGR
jgi:uracil-DNA glycosylase